MTTRLDAVDVARGLALLAMAAYHFTWDLAYFGLVAPATPFTPAMRAASHVIACAFLALAGLSLALAYPDGLRMRPFLKRALRIGAAAALVSGATLAFAPKSPILFGILHCILVASLVAAPLVARPRAALALGGALAVAPLVLSAPAFNAPWLMWLGLNTQDPATLDWRPLMPWGGALLIGLGLGRLSPRPPAAPARGAPLGALAFAGRHSLAVYLVHQPILVGLLYAAVHLSGFAERQSAAAYERSCRPACVEAGGDAESCARACACVVRDASAAGLGGRLGAGGLAAPERARIGGIVNACARQAR
jgi:uncharacterized membrane protein